MVSYFQLGLETDGSGRSDATGWNRTESGTDYVMWGERPVVDGLTGPGQRLQSLISPPVSPVSFFILHLI
jgi:hypothetical protein